MRKPIIGLSGCHELDKEWIYMPHDYIRSVELAGGLPVVLPVTTDAALIEAQLAAVDGLVLTGGPDVNPLLFGEEPIPKMGAISPERDEFDLALARAALERKMPALAICRGEQVLNLAGGGTIFQDIYAQNRDCFKHRQEAPRWLATHTVEVVPGTRLASLLGEGKTSVNTFHHQAVKELAPGFVLSASSGDGIIEAYEVAGHPFAIGVQWHPESFWRQGNFLCLFRALVEAAQARRDLDG
ncbi:MAG: gamma-glutamyl-gamma-aminobutyrate hydrolase family protein [Bacillota bacterium]